MAINVVQVIWAGRSGTPEDVAVNTWHFITAVAKDPVTAADVEAKISAFYNAFSSFYSSQLTGAFSIKWYDLADAKPRAPWRTVSPPNQVLNAGSLPSEVAYVLSFKAVMPSGAVAARRRGRLYLGPLSPAAIGVGQDGDRPSSSFVAAVSAGTQGMLDATGVSGWQWAIHSRIGSGTKLAPVPETYPVVAAWHDNALDTQRRRGRKATSRVNLS